MASKAYIIDGIADIRDAVEAFGRWECGTGAGCMDCGCPLFAWCARASTQMRPHLGWVHRIAAQRRKAAADKARRNRGAR